MTQKQRLALDSFFRSGWGVSHLTSSWMHCAILQARSDNWIAGFRKTKKYCISNKDSVE